MGSRQIAEQRITSTYVENTFLLSAASSTSRDHLHIRGEYKSLLMGYLKNTGSPPHTWRIHADLSDKLYETRITSTYVENTKNTVTMAWLAQDHLHIRGEYSQVHTRNIGKLGSPPHTWRILFTS